MHAHISFVVTLLLQQLVILCILSCPSDLRRDIILHCIASQLGSCMLIYSLNLKVVCMDAVTSLQDVEDTFKLFMSHNIKVITSQPVQVTGPPIPWTYFGFSVWTLVCCCHVLGKFALDYSIKVSYSVCKKYHGCHWYNYSTQQLQLQLQ